MNNDSEQYQTPYQGDCDEDYGRYRRRPPWFKWTTVLLVLAFLAFALPNLIHSRSASHGLRQDPALSSDPLAQAARSAIVLVQARTETGLALQGKRGTGFNILDNGAIITNEHVVAGALSVSVLFSDGRIYYTNRWQRVGDADLVVLDIRAEGLPVLPVKDYLPQSGQTVTVIGNPLDMERLVQKGPVSMVSASAPSGGPDRQGCFEILITAAPGLSGSPVIDDSGAVIGVVYAARQGTDPQGSSTALAIPLAAVNADLQSALKRLK